MHKLMLAVMMIVGFYSSSMIAGQRDALNQEARKAASKLVKADGAPAQQPTCFDQVQRTVLAVLQALQVLGKK